MKVVHLNMQDRKGGAGKAVFRLHKKLIELGVDSQLLVSHLAYQNDDTVGEADISFFGRIKRKYIKKLENLPFRIHHYYRESEFSVNWISQVNVNNRLITSADIVGLYWIGHGFISPKEVGNINKPIVWRLSDTWPFTGGCHYPGNCTKYEEVCGACPKIHSKNKNDFTYKTIRSKLKYWQSLNMTVVAPSKWIADCAARSTVFKGKPINVIPSGIDHHFFSPIDKELAKTFFHIDKDHKVILFGAAYADSDLRKGYDLLLKILERLDEKGFPLTLLIFGNTGKLQPPTYKNLKSIILNDVESQYLLRMAYCASDVFIAPYREDNLPNTVIEAMSCGTPCVAFEIGGLPELIDHKLNGYLAKPYDLDDMIDGILWVLGSRNLNDFTKKARQKIVEGRFTLEDQAMSYLHLYRKILENNGNGSI